MGILLYGNPSIEISFDDRALQHLQIVITAKLRRRESFVFSWNDSADVGSGRSSIWLDPSSTLYYRYFGSRVPAINREWIDVLMESANSGGGLFFLPEPGTGAHNSPIARSRG
ncbi:ATP-dependent DNA ligase [Subtercola boreus]|uniref:ATP-dependent DNA ligase n=1 Tax=Subtercola boreus TaxID=120213 RepID=A0A3E0VXH1_9MICO|nr:ATP-dependent DNA ligase [Subtercola boreus]RFA14179.1 ATP-dependent DNA ligase [Subtercola boreus]